MFQVWQKQLIYLEHFIQGTLLTRDNTIDGGEPVEITEVAPTVY